MSSLTMQDDGSSYDLVVRIFSDDLTIDLWRLYQPDEDYFADHMYIGPDSWYEKYVNDNMQVLLNGKAIPGKLEMVEKLELETVIRLEIPVKGRVRSLEIDNRLLTGLYMDQVNLFIYKDEESEKAFRFTVEEHSGTIVGKQ